MVIIIKTYNSEVSVGTRFGISENFALLHCTMVPVHVHFEGQ